MAELSIYIGDSGDPEGFQDGDVIEAITDTRIARAHTQNICNVRRQGFNRDGLRQARSLPDRFFELTSQYKFERISPTEVRRTNLVTQAMDTLSETPNANDEYILSEQYVRRRKQHQQHKVFGTAGAEWWYSGGRRLDMIIMGQVWDLVEAHTAERRADYQLWPATPAELRKNLLLKTTTDITNTQSDAYTQKGDGRKRDHKVGYDLLTLGVTTESIRDKSAQVDVRGVEQLLTVVEIKINGEGPI